MKTVLLFVIIASTTIACNNSADSGNNADSAKRNKDGSTSVYDSFSGRRDGDTSSYEGMPNKISDSMPH